MHENRTLRRVELAHAINRRRELLEVMKFTGRILAPPLSEEHKAALQRAEAELRDMESEYHRLNVEQIREDLKDQ